MLCDIITDFEPCVINRVQLSDLTLFDTENLEISIVNNSQEFLGTGGRRGTEHIVALFDLQIIQLNGRRIKLHLMNCQSLSLLVQGQNVDIAQGCLVLEGTDNH